MSTEHVVHTYKGIKQGYQIKKSDFFGINVKVVPAVKAIRFALKASPISPFHAGIWK